ncbi:hypothetical protein EKO27_g10615 [Xylaria grammica]|uniref:J domain-containing protein n=1 Tax=Xylaria grammica TaxID=363999 RepID=A0A439CQQ8_9PEZI|nr:hypothetical protein EKO27_g10615 [Xylaria grammica]
MDFYERLNIPKNADDAAIQKAFKELSLAMHPDKANVSTIPPGGNETAEERRAREQHNHERFVKIVEARDTLLDPNKRRGYDAKLRAGKYSTDGYRSGGSGGPSRSSKPSKSTKSKEPEPKDDPGQSSNTLKWLEYLVRRLNERLTTFHDLAPRSRSSSAYPEYSEIVYFFERVIAMTEKLVTRLGDAERVRNKDSAARGNYDFIKSQCGIHVQNARQLLGEVDWALAMHDRAVSRDRVYRSLYATFISFLG